MKPILLSIKWLNNFRPYFLVPLREIKYFTAPTYSIIAFERTYKWTLT